MQEGRNALSRCRESAFRFGSVGDDGGHVRGGNAVDRAVEPVGAQGLQHVGARIAAAREGRADGPGVHGGEKVAVDGGAADHALLHVDLELHPAAGQAARARNVEPGVRAEDALPAGEARRGDSTRTSRQMF